VFRFCFSANIVTQRCDSVSMDSVLIGNVTDDACGRIRSDGLEAVKLIALVLA